MFVWGPAQQRLWGFFICCCYFYAYSFHIYFIDFFELSSLSPSKSQQGTESMFSWMDQRGEKKSKDLFSSLLPTKWTSCTVCTNEQMNPPGVMSRWLTCSFIFFFCDTFSCSPGCLQTHYVSTTVLEVLILQPPRLMCTNTLSDLDTIENALCNMGWILLQ